MDPVYSGQSIRTFWRFVTVTLNNSVLAPSSDELGRWAASARVAARSSEHAQSPRGRCQRRDSEPSVTNSGHPVTFEDNADRRAGRTRTSAGRWRSTHVTWTQSWRGQAVYDWPQLPRSTMKFTRGGPRRYTFGLNTSRQNIVDVGLPNTHCTTRSNAESRSRLTVDPWLVNTSSRWTVRVSEQHLFAVPVLPAYPVQSHPVLISCVPDSCRIFPDEQYQY